MLRSRGLISAKLDFAVISHRHGDHTGGINYLLTVNPQVKISRRKRDLEYLAPHCLEPFIAKMPHCRIICGMQWEAAADDDLRHAVAQRQFCSN